MNKVYDVLIIGGGIAGLSASICTSTEGFSTIVVDAGKFGGQAGTASLIENLIGFPNGVCGKELLDNSIRQANKFGVILKGDFHIVNIKRDEDVFISTNADGNEIISKTIVLALGQEYKKFDINSLDKFIGKGVSYTSPIVTQDYSDKTVSVIGGANSAGQASVFLSQCLNCNVNLIVRGSSLENSMSHYLYQKIYKIPNIKVFFDTEVTECIGDEHLEEIVIKTEQGIFNIKSDELFILIGSSPKTEWLKDFVNLDQDGFIITDENLRACEGVFSIGDVRSNSIKRVSCAIGEGGRVVKGIRARINQTLTKS